MVQEDEKKKKKKTTQNGLGWNSTAQSTLLRSSQPLIRVGIQIIFFLFLHKIFLHKNIFCGYSLEAPRRGASNEYLQHMFLWRNKKNINTFWLKKKAAYQELWVISSRSVLYLTTLFLNNPLSG